MNEDAEYYDQLRDSGKSHAMAVALVEARRKSREGAGVAGAVRTAAQGVTAGFSDELEGAAHARPRPWEVATKNAIPVVGPALTLAGRLLGKDERRDVATERARESVRQFRDDHPVASFALEGAGALATGIGGAGALAARGAARAAAPSLGRTAARLAAAGAAEGAAYGAGSAEGGPAERLTGAAGGAAVGGVAGVAVPAVASRAGRVGRRVLDALAARPKGAGQSSRVGRVFEAAGVRSMDDRAKDKVADAVLADAGSFETAATQLAKGGKKPTTLMDLGQNTAGLARASRATPGAAKKQIPAALTTRMAGQEDRLIGDLLETTGVRTRNDVVQTVDDIIAERAANSRPLYDLAYSFDVKDARVLKVLNSPAFAAAYQKGRRIAAEEGVDLPDPFKIVDGKRMLDTSATVPVQALDYMKRGMDDLIEARSRGGKMARQEARALRNRLNRTLEMVDELVPEFAHARAYYKGESDMLEAFEAGRKLFDTDPSEARKLLAGMTEGERIAFKKGATESVATRLEDVAKSHDATLRRPLQDRTRDRQRLRLLFDTDDAFTEFKNRIAQEAEMAGTQRFVMGGSNTADKLMELAQLADVTVGPAFDVARGNISGLVQRAANSAVRRRAQGYSGQLSEMLAPRLTATGPQAANVLDDVRSYLTRQQARQGQRRALTAGTSGGLAGLHAGSSGESSTDRRYKSR